ncbi:mitochondrial inner membrane protease ATP23 [Spathaspora passalidarum NRRL Y-27907]|uniref:Mitochondrial inner membrane protease ATP23 n=1 Tax=Spathaspora passalidarum (strain NRRL Y-27907 / 11-Y1) TaxID=619300 RepID=G3AKP1_SPAPN|nr:mitochondrial inner membrane protease ATP23 [Spathaspora passalidarum NRRL Y-27907]EGW32945.1 mitochondrial inner membrane protease ATP23 [Spathaspora passalidarum NRRL Y-27907]
MSQDKPAETTGNNLKLSPQDALSGFSWWTRTLQYATGLGISDQEKLQYEYDYQNRNLDEKCVQCNEYRDWMLTYSPSVTFMMSHINKLTKDNRPALDKSNVVCDVCDDLKGGGFHPDEGILLCANWLRSRSQLEDVLTHELVHAYDYLRFNIDLTDLRHHACTEIRASMLSGECRIMNEIKKTGLGNFGRKFQDCVRRRAVLSVSANPKCTSKEEAEKVVNTVWNSCFNDTRPFERVYR